MVSMVAWHHDGPLNKEMGKIVHAACRAIGARSQCRLFFGAGEVRKKKIQLRLLFSSQLAKYEGAFVHFH
jgi:hypothetical protein